MKRRHFFSALLAAPVMAKVIRETKPSLEKSKPPMGMMNLSNNTSMIFKDNVFVMTTANSNIAAGDVVVWTTSGGVIPWTQEGR